MKSYNTNGIVKTIADCKDIVDLNKYSQIPHYANYIMIFTWFLGYKVTNVF